MHAKQAVSPSPATTPPPRTGMDETEIAWRTVQTFVSRGVKRKKGGLAFVLDALPADECPYDGPQICNSHLSFELKRAADPALCAAVERGNIVRVTFTVPAGAGGLPDETRMQIRIAPQAGEEGPVIEITRTDGDGT